MQQNLRENFKTVESEFQLACKIAENELNKRWIKKNAKKLLDTLKELVESVKDIKNKTEKEQEELINATVVAEKKSNELQESLEQAKNELRDTISRSLQYTEELKEEHEEEIKNAKKELEKARGYVDENNYNSQSISVKDKEKMVQKIKSETDVEYSENLKDLEILSTELKELLEEENTYHKKLLWFLVGFLFTAAGAAIMSFWWLRKRREEQIRQQNSHNQEKIFLRGVLEESEDLRNGKIQRDEEEMEHREEVEQALPADENEEQEEQELAQNNENLDSIASKYPELITLLVGAFSMLIAAILGYKLRKYN